jgi:hypothetical protein
LSICSNGTHTQHASVMRAIFPGCEVTPKDLYWVIRKKNGTHLHDTQFGRALRAQGELDDEDGQITQVVLSQPIVKISLNALGTYWTNKLGLIPEGQLPPQVIDPSRDPKPLWTDVIRTPTKLVCMLALFTKYLKKQIAEQVCSKIPNCSLDDVGVMHILFRKANRGVRLVDRPFYRSLEAKEDLSLEESKLAWMVVRSGHFALPHELSEIGQHYYNTLYNFPEEEDWKEASLPSLAMAEILKIAEGEFKWRNLFPESWSWTEPPIVGVVAQPSPSPSPDSTVLSTLAPDTAGMPKPAQQIGGVQQQQQQQDNWADMSRQMVTGPEPIIAMTEGQLRAFGEGRITYAELISASQHAKLYAGQHVSSADPDGAAVPVLTSAASVPQMFSDVFYQPNTDPSSGWTANPVPISYFQPADPHYFSLDSQFPPAQVQRSQPLGWGTDLAADFPAAQVGPGASGLTGARRSNRPGQRKEPYSRR